MGWTTEQAAQFLGVTKSAVTKLCRGGIIQATMHGRDWDIDPESVKYYAANRPKPGPKEGSKHR